MRASIRVRDLVLLGSLGVVIILASVLTSRTHRTPALVLPLLAGGFAYLAMTRFALVTLIMLAARTAIEVLPFTPLTDLLRISVLATGAYAVAGVIWLIQERRAGPMRPSLVAWAVAGVAMASVISAVLSPDQVVAATGASKWVFLAVLVPVLERLCRTSPILADPGPLLKAGGPRFVKLALVAIATSMIVPLAMGASQIAADPEAVITGAMRISGSFSHPNTYGFYLVVMALILLSVTPSLTRLGKGLALGLSILSMVQLAATHSRTSYVALVTGLVVLGLLARRWILMLAPIALVVAAMLVPSVSQRWEDLDQSTTLRGTPGNALAWRVEYWETVLETTADRRLTGLGLGVVAETTDQEREPHNDFVRAAAEMGVIGLLAYLILLGALISRAARSARVQIQPGASDLSKRLSQGFSAVMAAFLIGSVTGNLMTQLVLLWYVLTLAVLASPTIQQVRDAGRSRLSHV